MTEQEVLQKMVAPAGPRPGKPYRGGVIQIHITRACDKSCFACTQGSNLGGKTEFMSPEHFEQAVRSLGFDGNEHMPELGHKPYFGVVGVFGGNPALSPHFSAYCETLRRLVPFEQRGLWCNNPVTIDKAKEMARTFDPSVSNLNVHLDSAAYEMFKLGWPASHVVGLTGDSRHSPVHLAMKDVVKEQCDNCAGQGGYFDLPNGERYLSDPGAVPRIEQYWTRCPDCGGIGKVADNDRIRELISTCDINQHWSAMIGVFRGELRAWFCEVAGAQAMLHQGESDYPDTGVRIIQAENGDIQCGYQWAMYEGTGEIDPVIRPQQWWKWDMDQYAGQVRKHCFECGVPLRGYGELSQSLTGKEQTSATHSGVFKPKRKGREVEVVTRLEQLGLGKIQRMTSYLQNAKL